jgi:hypothetical protein
VRFARFGEGLLRDGRACGPSHSSRYSGAACAGFTRTLEQAVRGSVSSPAEPVLAAAPGLGKRLAAEGEPPERSTGRLDTGMDGEARGSLIACREAARTRKMRTTTCENAATGRFSTNDVAKSGRAALLAHSRCDTRQ